MKIAFIALSGIRVCDKELLAFGLTLPGFVERSKVVASLPSLGLLTLAAITPDNHEKQYFELIDLTTLNEIPTNFDLVAISSYSAQINEAYEVADKFKADGIAVVMGGLHVSALPDEALEHCDSIVIGEGEPCWPEVLQDAEKKNLQKKYHAKGFDYDLAESPLPALNLLDISNYNRLTVQTSRGCPHKCEFCGGSILLTEKYKQKPLENVLAEIDQICKIWKHPFIEFADDNSFVNKTYWKKLLRKIKSKRIKWFTETDISVSDDPELLKLMHDSGCAQILIGFESPVKNSLKGIEMHSNWKYDKFEKYKQAIYQIQSHGITVNGCFVLGLDGQNPNIFDEVYNFVKETELFEVQITILTPFPGTPLYARLKEENRLIEPTNWQKCTLFDINFIPSDMTVEELSDGFRKLASKLYNEDFIKWRRDNFKKFIRLSRKLN